MGLRGGEKVRRPSTHLLVVKGKDSINDLIKYLL